MSEKRHIEKALDRMKEVGLNTDFITVDPEAVTVTFKIQSDPIKMVGVDGCQALDMLIYTKHLFVSLNKVFPCPENKRTIKHIMYAAIEQLNRTKDHEKRGVEGKNEG